MNQILRKNLLFVSEFAYKGYNIIRNNLRSILACIFSFSIVFGTTYLIASRNIAIKQVRWQMQQTFSKLNELGLDIAYDNIKFNSMFFSPLVKIDNFQIYNIKGLNSWSVKFNVVKAYPNIFGTPKIRFESSDGGLFSLNDFSATMISQQTFLDISNQNNKLDELVFHAENIDIKNFAKIEKIAFLLQSTKQNTTNQAMIIPSYESFFEVNSVDINGLVNYPLSSKLKLLYAKTNILGNLPDDDYLLTSLETWLKEGGFIEVPNLIVQWEPLTLVGRGTINFNEVFSPRIDFNTSSKGLLRLIKDLQENEFLDSKNVFVANIMLSNKAFKMNPDDTELTISTPISYADKKITIENLTIKDFTK